ncbi:Pnap_2097 family protein [Agrobacterium sp. T29]|uniref:Pnap_2097 family protein n=1 Tax=Agrobacterium sp. T29 TaxID=2580515 RepID=UPI001FF06CAE|nr:Pnap_2097 family protein [Agrobacterium sp. T29]
MSLLAIHPSAQPALVDRHVLGMAEMGYNGLSEQWLLRRAGDLHWRLIARAMGQKDAVFTCSAGQPLYAAFCATTLNFTRPEIPQLGGELTLAADLYRIGHGRLVSSHRITVNNNEIGRVVLISTFVGRSEPASNHSIVRRTPKVIAMPPEAPRAVQRIGREAASVARFAVRGNHDLLTGEETRKILPCPSVDFNAAGLLYFPSFSALADRAFFEMYGKVVPIIASRKVVYLGNVEPGEWVDICFHKSGASYDAVLCGTDYRPLALMRIRLRAS